MYHACTQLQPKP